MKFDVKLHSVHWGAGTGIGVKRIEARLYTIEKTIPYLGGTWEWSDGEKAGYFQFTNPSPVGWYAMTYKVPEANVAKKLEAIRQILARDADLAPADGRVRIVVVSEESLNDEECTVRFVRMPIPTHEDVMR